VKRALRDFLLGLAYRDGTGKAHVGAVDLYANCLLIEGGVRPAFMVQSVDYGSSGDGLDMAEFIVNEMMKGGFRSAPSSQGIIVFTDTMSSTIRPMVSKYDKNGSDKLMGRILGYPAWDDFPGSDRSKPRLGFSWEVKLRGYAGYHQVMANVFRDMGLIHEMEELASKMADHLEPKGFEVFTKLRKMPR